MTTEIRVLAFTRYGQLGASSRMRVMQYLDSFRRGGCDVTVRPLLDDQYLRALYAGRRNLRSIFFGYIRRFFDCLGPMFGKADCILVEKELWPWAPAQLELILLRRKAWVLDLDDAIFHNYDRHRNPLVRRMYGRKIDRLMKAATIVTAGSPYLADRAKQAGARDVRIIPTAVDLAKYPAKVPKARASAPARDLLVIGWIGSPATAHYLNVVTTALQQVGKKIEITLRVIGAEAPTIAGVKTESVPWTAASEVDQICRFDIGIMPLIDSAWERGKCGYKLIQYMACGLPVIASPIGVNVNLVTPGVCGLLAASPEQWESAILDIAGSHDRGRELGATGRRRVEEHYCTDVTGLAVIASVKDAVSRKKDRGQAESPQPINDKQ